jgi:hypothetical protein
MLNALGFLTPTKFKLALWLVMVVALCVDELIGNELEALWFFAKIPALDAAWRTFNQVGHDAFSEARRGTS